MASLSSPGARLGMTGLFDVSLRAIVDCAVVGSASALGFEAGGAVGCCGCGCGCGLPASAIVLSTVLPRDIGMSVFGIGAFSGACALWLSSERNFGLSGSRSISTLGLAK